MALVNSTVQNKIWINGIDVTSAVIRGSVTDDSVLSGSIVTSRGDIECSHWAGTQDMLDVSRTIFPIGSQVVVGAVLPNGNFVRHPRGLLYIMNSNVNIEEQTITFRVGCSLALLSENESSYPSAVAQLWAHVDSAVFSACNIENRDLASLATALQATGKAIYQNQYGNIWAIDLLKINQLNAPALVVSDKYTAISITAIEDPSAIAPSSYEATASYGLFRPVQEDDEDTTPTPGYDPGDGSDVQNIDGATPNIDGVGTNGGGGGETGEGGSTAGPGGGRASGPYIQWSRQNVKGYSKYDSWLYWKLLVYSGMKFPEERDDGLYNAWCSYFYEYRKDPDPPPKPSWAYGITTNEVVTKEITYPTEVKSTTRKYFNLNGQETYSETLETATWKSIASSLIDQAADRTKQFANYWLGVAQDCLGKINNALTARDEHPRSSSAFWYYQCVHIHWVSAANDALDNAKGWFSHGAALKDSGMRPAWSNKITVETEYGPGGEVISKITNRYENEGITRLYQEKLALRFERGLIPQLKHISPLGLVLTSTTKEKTKYNSDGSAQVITEVLDYQDPSRNSITVSWDGDSRNAAPMAGVAFGGGNNEPLTDETGKQSKSTPGEEPTPDPDNPGETLPYPDTWDNRKVDQETGKLLQPAKCNVEVEQIELVSRVPGSLSNAPSIAAGWLGSQQSYVQKIQFPLQFLGDQLLMDNLGNCVPVSASMSTAVSLLNKYAQIFAAIERGKDGGFSVSEVMRPEMYNIRPLSDVDVQLATLDSGYRCKVDNCVWVFDQNQALVNLNLFKMASF